MGDAWCNDSEMMVMLEALVGNLSIRSDSVDRSLVKSSPDTCVMLQFLHYPPLMICESDFLGYPVDHVDPENIYFGSGKSCLFSLRVPRGRPLLPIPFQIKVSAVRKLMEGVLPNKMVIGEAVVDMSDGFHELVSLDVDESCDKLPMVKTTVGDYDLKDESGNNVGSVTILLRLSCLGKLVITQFNNNKETNAYLFKPTDAKQVCEVTKCRDPNVAGSGTTPNQLPVGDHRPLQNNTSLPPPPQISAGLPANRYQNNCPGCPCPQVPTAPPQYPPYPTQAYPMCNQPGAASTGLGPGTRNNQVVVQLPLKDAGARHAEVGQKEGPCVHYRVTSVEDTRAGPDRAELPTAAGQAGVGLVSGLPLDGDHDVFYIKLGRKCDGDKKKNVELEMRAPKLKDPKPATTTTETQYLVSDIADADPAASSKKGKGAKGGKEKNGKGKKGKGKKK